MVDGKTVGGKTTTYIYNAGMLLAEDNPDYRINFYYDSNGIATEIGYIEKAGGKFGKETFYFFTRNGQGDIVGIYRNADSTLVGSYEYDLWGNPVSVIENITKKVNGKTVTIRDEQGILEKNPLRYRGYYYDKETGFYYLNARYYDPKVHRFITPEPNFKVGKFDKNTGLNAYNLFAYCGNDPINLADQTGEFVITTTMLVVGICAAIGLTIGGIIGNVAADKKGLTGWDKACTILTYASIGGLLGAGTGFVLGELAFAYTGVYAVGITAEGIQLYNDLPQLGDKIEYLFGNATGTLHSIQRSLSMESALNRIGLFDDPEGRMEVYKALYRAYSLLGNVEANSEGRKVVESMVWGPYGYMGMQSFWEGGKLITAWFFEH